MTPNRVSRRVVRRLFDIRNCYNVAASQEKLELLQCLDELSISTSAEIKRLHSALCFIRAFPDSHEHFRVSMAALSQFAGQIGGLGTATKIDLLDTGIAGTSIHYAFSYEVACWMARHVSGAVSIDWDEICDTSRLDELLEQLLLPVEDEYFDSGLVSSAEWLRLASSGSTMTDFDWLLAQLQESRLEPFWAQLYNASELPLTWKLADSRFSRSFNKVGVRSLGTREKGMRIPGRSIKAEIMRPLQALRKLTRAAGSKLIDAGMASLAVRHRETYHFNYANPNEVYLADVGRGTSVAVFGLIQTFRFPLECTMGYLILSNGVPVGYGGSSVIFRQVNTGINIFDEYRGSEAAYLWIQVMRVYHHLVGCTLYIANPFQLGSENDEALQSGAFWFYYRLGYRPVLADVRQLAQRETARMRQDKSHRSSLPTLRRLACCDMNLTLRGARASDLFEERWIETSSMLATNELAATGCSTRAKAAQRLAENVAKDLGIRSLHTWSSSENHAFLKLAPIIATTNPGSWPAQEKRSMRKLLRTKGGPAEAEYARLLADQDYFLAALRKNCRSAENL